MNIFNLNIVYNDLSESWVADLQNIIKNKYFNVSFNTFHENKLKERKKAFQIKGSWSAKQTPFATLIDAENNPIKIFYSEAEECTLDNILYYLDSFIFYKNQNDYESTSSKDNSK